MVKEQILKWFQEEYSTEVNEFTEPFKEIYMKAGDELANIFDRSDTNNIHTDLVIEKVVSEYIKKGDLQDEKEETISAKQHIENIVVGIKKIV